MFIFLRYLLAGGGLGNTEREMALRQEALKPERVRLYKDKHLGFRRSKTI